MITKDDFYWKGENNQISPIKVELESVYSPSKRLWVKDPELDDAPKHILAIKCYKVIFTHQESFVNMIEFLDENGLLDYYHNTKSHDQVVVKNYYFGTILPTVAQEA